MFKKFSTLEDFGVNSVAVTEPAIQPASPAVYENIAANDNKSVRYLSNRTCNTLWAATMVTLGGAFYAAANYLPSYADIDVNAMSLLGTAAIVNSMARPLYPLFLRRPQFG